MQAFRDSVNIEVNITILLRPREIIAGPLDTGVIYFGGVDICCSMVRKYR
jgi:hypothetical protein